MWALAQLAALAPVPGIPVREQRRVFALDGKTVRGARSRATSSTTGGDGDEPVTAPHLVSVIDQASGAVLGQVQVDAKGSEIAAFTTLLDQLDLHEVLISADALHTQRGHARYLHERGGHYLLTVKANQPTLLRRLRALPWAQIPVANRQQARGHGRVETRAITVVSLERCPDLGGEFFPHAAQAIKLVRRRRRLGSRKWTTVTVYAITSLTAFQADPVLLARWIRGHWSIEALHWVRDVSFDEDRSQVRTGHGPQVMAALRNLAITALRLSGTTNIAAALRHHARDSRRPLATYKIT
jgi:predicted transposase YbfD/YdcC